MNIFYINRTKEFFTLPRTRWKYFLISTMTLRFFDNRYYDSAKRTISARFVYPEKYLNRVCHSLILDLTYNFLRFANKSIILEWFSKTLRQTFISVLPRDRNFLLHEYKIRNFGIKRNFPTLVGPRCGNRRNGTVAPWRVEKSNDRKKAA